MSKVEALTINETSMGLPLSQYEAERVASLTAVLSYLVQEGVIAMKPDYHVLDLGTGSGAGIYAWRALGIRDENIVGVDTDSIMMDRQNPFLFGEAKFELANVRENLRSTVGEKRFDIISAFLIPQFGHDYTRDRDEDRTYWLQSIDKLLREGNSFYIETMLEFYRLPQKGKWSYDNSSPFQTSYYSFMGDTLEVPDLPLLNPPIPSSIRMGYPLGDKELTRTTYLDGSKWVPCSPATGKPMPIIRRYYPHVKAQDEDEYGVRVEYQNGRKLYPFGKIKLSNDMYGYRDNIVAVHKKIGARERT